ncbi:MAG: hypothetical protein WBP85_00190 [Terracidiphilus sp.]
MNRSTRHTLGCAALACLLNLGTAGASTLTAYLSAPGEVATEINGATTETFNEVPLVGNQYNSNTLVSPIGTYVGNSTRIPIIAADQYGGANGSQYMYVGTRTGGDSTSVTLTLNSPADYFGFWWSAGDPANEIQVYSDGTLVATFTTASLTSFLSTPTVTSLGGAQYVSSSYYGNPNAGTFNGDDAAEPFAYVNLVATGFTFNQIVLTNDASSGFENDNNSIYGGSLDIPRDYTSFVKVEDIPVNTPVPEPNYTLLMGVILAAAAFWKLRAARVPVA